MCHKKNLHLKIIKSAEIGNKINYLEKNKIDADSLKKFTNYDKSKLKTQQRFKSERHNGFTEEINKIALSSNDDKGIQSIGKIFRK